MNNAPIGADFELNAPWNTRSLCLDCGREIDEEDDYCEICKDFADNEDDYIKDWED
jgi:hypothetical protein